MCSASVTCPHSRRRCEAPHYMLLLLVVKLRLQVWYLPQKGALPSRKCSTPCAGCPSASEPAHTQQQGIRVSLPPPQGAL